VELAQRIKMEGRRRQLQLIGKMLRSRDVEPIRQALDKLKNRHNQQVVLFHKLELLRDRLITDGDDAIADVLRLWPEADRQQLRSLIRNARKEKEGNKAPKVGAADFPVSARTGGKRSVASSADQPPEGWPGVFTASAARAAPRNQGLPERRRSAPPPTLLSHHLTTQILTKTPIAPGVDGLRIAQYNQPMSVHSLMIRRMRNAARGSRGSPSIHKSAAADARSRWSKDRSPSTVRGERARIRSSTARP
jgi:ribosome-associated protein